MSQKRESWSASATFDLEYLRTQATVEQLAHVCAGYIAKQFLLSTDAPLKGADVRLVCEALEEVGSDFDGLLLDFLSSYTEVTSSQGAEAGTSAVTILLVELLRFSLEPVKHVVLWLRLLGVLTSCLAHREALLLCKGAAVVMGAMAVHADFADVQTAACHVLGHVAMCAPLEGQKRAVRESGVELVLKALLTHKHDVTVVLPACTALVSVTSAYVTSGETDSPVVEMVRFKCLPEVLEASYRLRDDRATRDACLQLQDLLRHRTEVS